MYDYNNIELDYCIAMARAGYSGECDGDNKTISFVRED